MILYHGSYVEIVTLDIEHSRQNVDFGRGFYTTPIYEQAVNWCKKMRRSGKDKTSYDVVIGGVANDKVFNTVELYFEQLIDKSEAIKRLKYEKPNLQICFRTQQAIDACLRFERSETV